MEARVYLKNIKIPPKKLRFLLPAIKKLKPMEAMDYLIYMPNRSARILHMAIKSAVYNAKNTYKIDENLLKFKLLTIEEGQKLKRFKPGGRGTAKPIKRRFSHIKIVVETEEGKIKHSSKAK